MATTDGIKISALSKIQQSKLDNSYLLSYVEENGTKNYQIPFSSLKEKIAEDTTDSEYNPESDNAQSGKAIAAMIESLNLDARFKEKADKKYVRQLKADLGTKATKEELDEVRESLESSRTELTEKIESSYSELNEKIEASDELLENLSQEVITQIEKITQLENGESLDDEVTESSSRGVKSSGIYKFIQDSKPSFSYSKETTESTETASANFFVLDKRYFPQGKIKKILIPQPTQISSTAPFHLALCKWNTGTLLVEEVLAYSINTDTQGNNKTLEFLFDNVDLSKEESVMICGWEEIPATNINSNFVDLRIYVDTAIDADDTVTQIKYRNNRFNWLARLAFEYEYTFNIIDNVEKDAIDAVKSSGIFKFVTDKTDEITQAVNIISSKVEEIEGIEVDQTVTASSTHAVSSKAVYDYVSQFSFELPEDIECRSITVKGGSRAISIASDGSNYDYNFGYGAQVNSTTEISGNVQFGADSAILKISAKGNALVGANSEITSGRFGNLFLGENCTLYNISSSLGNIISGNGLRLLPLTGVLYNTWIIAGNPQISTSQWNSISRHGLVLIGGTETPYRVYWPNTTTWAAQIYGWTQWTSEHNIKDKNGNLVVENGELKNLKVVFINDESDLPPLAQQDEYTLYAIPEETEVAALNNEIQLLKSEIKNLQSYINNNFVKVKSIDVIEEPKESI